MDTINWITLVTGLLSKLGIGSVLTALIQYTLKRKESSFQSQREDLEKRYNNSSNVCSIWFRNKQNIYADQSA